jgi:hypothetical protein
MPQLSGELAGDQGGAALEAVIQDFEEEAGFVFSKRFQSPIIKDQ